MYSKIQAILLVLIVMGSADVLHAQRRPEYVGRGNWFVGLGAGGSWSLAENAEDSYRLWMPSISLSVGRTYNKWLAFRLNGGIAPQYGMPSKIAARYYPEIYKRYQFNVAEAYGDVIFNMTNTVRRYDENKLFDLDFLVGAGAVRTFGFSSYVDEWEDAFYPVDSHERTFFAGRIGFIGAYHIRPAWDLQFELDFNLTDNSYNGVRGKRSGDLLNLYVSAGASLVYYFKDRTTGRHRFMVPPRSILERYEPFDESPWVKPGDTLSHAVMFQLERDELSKVQHSHLRDVAAYMAAHPEQEYVLCGYPDSKVGPEATRVRLARQRVEAVRRMLVRKMGITPDRLDVRVSAVPSVRTVAHRWCACGVTFTVKEADF